MRGLCFFVACLAVFSCSPKTDPQSATLIPESSPYQFDASPVSDTPDYPGKTIDEVFPIISEKNLSDKEMGGKKYSVQAANFSVEFSNFTPISIRNDKAVLLNFKADSAGDYWSNLVGKSNLLGEKSSEIYVVATGPGAVCCTNYWINDISSGKPKSIFRSEDYGRFRDAMEIFDAEGDGVYELVQFDSCFRYFLDDCGSCSPEPRAVFKYDEKKGEYRPTKEIQQDFVKESMVRAKETIREKYETLQQTKDIGTESDVSKLVLDHVVNLLYLGRDKEAWQVFEKYKTGDSTKVIREIEFRLAGCKFYQALKRTK